MLRAAMNELLRLEPRAEMVSVNGSRYCWVLHVDGEPLSHLHVRALEAIQEAIHKVRARG